MHATLLHALLLLAAAQVPPSSASPATQALKSPAPPPETASAPATPPAAEAVPGKEEPGPVEKAINRIPPILWDKDATFNERLGKVASAVMVVAGVASLALALAGIGLTATLQLSPWPQGSDYRQRPRSTFITAAMAITAGLTIAGAVATLGGLFALFVA